MRSATAHTPVERAVGCAHDGVRARSAARLGTARLHALLQHRWRLAQLERQALVLRCRR